MKRNIAVIGCGYWGPNLIRNLIESGRCSKLTCFDLDEKRLTAIARRFPSLQTTTSIDTLLNDDNLEAVLIATPISTHHPLGKRFLEAGKSVFIEKPLAASVAEAEELIEIASRKGLTLMVGHTFEYSPPVLKVDELLKEKGMGNICYIDSTRVNLGLVQKDVSVVWDLCPHDFSMLFHWIGEEPTHVSAIGRANVLKGIPDVAFVNLHFGNGVIAHVTVSWLAPSKLRRTSIVCENKMIIYDDSDPNEKIKVFDKGVDVKEPQTFGEYQLTYRTGDILSPRLDTYEPLGVEVNHFLDCARDKTKPKSDGESGLRVVRSLVAVEESIRKNGTPVSL